MSYHPDDYTLVKEPDYFNQFNKEADDEFPDITDDREPGYLYPGETA